MKAPEADSATIASEKNTLTPMMRQWLELKARAPQALLFFRLGDFYELFEEDAIKAAPVLGVQLTARNHRGSQQGSSAALCGVPAVNLEPYLVKALDQGFKIAIAEQVEEPSPGKTLVRREIIQYLTPGIRLLQSDDRPHYAGVLVGGPNSWSLAAADVATGHIVLESGQGLEGIADLIERLPIEDLRVPREDSRWDLRVKWMETQFLLSEAQSEALILDAFGLSQIADSPAESRTETQALGSLLHLLKEAHPREKLRYLRPRSHPHSVWISSYTRKNLNLFDPPKKNVFEFLNHTLTALGRRELRDLLANPIRDLATLEKRREIIKFFKENNSIRKDFRSKLASVYDLHRLLRKRRGPQQLLDLSKSLSAGLEASVFLPKTIEDFCLLQAQSTALEPLMRRLTTHLQESNESDSGWIAPGVSSVLDELRDLKQNAAKMLSDLEESLRKETKVNSLKIKFHQVFGYIVEVSLNHRDKIPDRGKRIQTLSNGERFKIPELESLEEKILSLDSRIREAERAQLENLLMETERNQALLLDWAETLGKLDALQSLADVSCANQWTTPEIFSSADAQILKIEKAVHPLAQTSFVPLSFELNSQYRQIVLLTGPNMAGKSTLLRTAALTALLTQMGSDVPAANAKLSLFDRIACRMGASDDLNSGQSTFFVEMREVASMLHGATPQSLLIFDEIGRGTSTFDGMSLAWAITEEVHSLGALSLIATHYLELSELEKTLLRLKSYHLGVQDKNGRLIFTRELKEGPASRSYGIHVARLADLSQKILDRAEAKLHEFEKRRSRSTPLLELYHSSERLH